MPSEYATLGEVCGVLQEVFGEYEEKSMVSKLYGGHLVGL